MSSENEKLNSLKIKQHIDQQNQFPVKMELKNTTL